MRDVLRVGDREVLEFTVTRQKTVPFLYPESPEFQAIPEVFATGYMVGLMEWCCIRSLAPALEAGEGSLGTAIEVSHAAATPPGGRVRVEATVVDVQGRRVCWHVVARDDLDVIGEGHVGRTVVLWDRFTAALDQKAQAIADKRAAGETADTGRVAVP